jgi:crotonobetainyl-CoA:carnitine CoA-transferase CaiB-like acyl-CoA transferase
MTTERPQPLKGVRIVDFTTVLSGPYCTYQLALLGADVVKVERPGIGDRTRRGADLPGMRGLAAVYVSQNGSKRSIQIDLKKPEGLALAKQLIGRCDVMVENYTPGVAERIGLGYEAMRALNPRMVYASLSGYGQDGPYSGRSAYDHVIQGISGITMITGTPETVPNRIGPPLFDYLAGIYGAFAVLAALKERDRTGQGQRIDVAMLDAALVAMASFSSQFLNGGREPKANGNTAASGSPASGIFPTRDGLLSLAANAEHHVVRLCKALGEPDLLSDDRFAKPDVRLQHFDAFGEALVGRLATRSAAEWETLLSAAQVPAVKVRTLPEILGDPHVAARGVQQRMTDPASGKTISVPTAGFKWNGQVLGPQRVPSRLGEDTDDVLRELGLDAAAIAGLKSRQVV